MRYIFLICVALNAAGCVSQRAVLVNERGEEITCETSAYGAFPSLMVPKTQNECIAEAEKRGYRVKQND